MGGSLRMYHSKKKIKFSYFKGGLGEDASFDIEFAREYDCKIFLLDPTPKRYRIITVLSIVEMREKRTAFDGVNTDSTL